MAKGFKHGAGGGGGSLELIVVGDVTQPTKATQHTIWVNTDVEITEVRLCAEESECDNEGAVWITIGDVTHNKMVVPVGGNMIEVHPVIARQCIGGAWIEKPAKSYMDGMWHDWIPAGALYWRGNECTEVTDGWECMAWKMQSDAVTTAQTFNIYRNADHIVFRKTGDIGAVMYAVNPINLTGVKAIRFRGEMSPATKASWVAFYVWTKMGGTYWATNSVATVQTSTNGKTEFLLDVSALTGLHYIGFAIYSSPHYVRIDELSLEVE